MKKSTLVLASTAVVVMVVLAGFACYWHATNIAARRVDGAAMAGGRKTGGAFYYGKNGLEIFQPPDGAVYWVSGRDMGVVWSNRVLITPWAIYQIEPEMLYASDGSEPFTHWEPRLKIESTNQGAMHSFTDLEGHRLSFRVNLPP